MELYQTFFFRAFLQYSNWCAVVLYLEFGSQSLVSGSVQLVSGDMYLIFRGVNLVFGDMPEMCPRYTQNMRLAQISKRRLAFSGSAIS